MPVLKMNINEMLCLTGPMSIGINSGRIEVLFKEFSRGDRLVIHKYRNYIIHAVEETELDIVMGDDAKIQQVDENEPYLERIIIVNNIVSNKYSRVVILGGVDSGKSTLSILLSNKALREGLKPAVIDGDIGQADIGPPGFVSMSYPDKQVLWMRELKPVSMKFIGDIKPQNYVDRVIHALVELAEQAYVENKFPVIIDTDGWISDDYAVSYKYRLLSELKPDAIVVIGEDAWSIFSRYENIGAKIYRTRTPVNKRTRSREERRQLRRDKYFEYLNNSPQRRVCFDKIVFIGHFLLHSSELPSISVDNSLKPDYLKNILYLTKSFNTLNVVVSNSISEEQLEFLKKTTGCERVRTFSENSLRKLYVAVSDGRNDYPGLIDWFDFRNREVVLRTSFINEIKFIKISRIRLTEEYIEQAIE